MIAVAVTRTVTDALANHFVELPRNSTDKPVFKYRASEEQQHIDFTPVRNENHNLIFSVIEFDFTLSESSESAPIPDGITYSILKLVPENTKSFSVLY